MSSRTDASIFCRDRARTGGRPLLSQQALSARPPVSSALRVEVELDVLAAVAGASMLAVPLTAPISQARRACPGEVAGEVGAGPRPRLDAEHAQRVVAGACSGFTFRASSAMPRRRGQSTTATASAARLVARQDLGDALPGPHARRLTPLITPPPMTTACQSRSGSAFLSGSAGRPSAGPAAGCSSGARDGDAPHRGDRSAPWGVPTARPWVMYGMISAVRLALALAVALARRRIWSCRAAGGRRPASGAAALATLLGILAAGDEGAGNWRCTSSMIFCSSAGGERGRAVVVDHRAAALVAAFLQDALGRDVARGVVGVGVDPQARAVELLLQPQRVIDDDLAGQEDHRQRVAERPRLDRVGELRLQLLAAVELGELHAGVVADGVLALRPSPATRSRVGRRVEQQLDFAGLRRRRAR